MVFLYTWGCFSAFNVALFGFSLLFLKRKFKNFPKLNYMNMSFVFLFLGGPVATFFLLKAVTERPKVLPQLPQSSATKDLEGRTKEVLSNTDREFQNREEMEGITFHPEIWMPGTMVTLSTSLEPQTVWFRCIPTPGLPICSHTVHRSEEGWKVYRQGVPTGYMMLRSKANSTFASKVDAFRFCNSDLEWDKTILNPDLPTDQRVKMLLEDKNQV